MPPDPAVSTIQRTAQSPAPSRYLVSSITMLDRHFNPPGPEPEPVIEIVYVSPEDRGSPRLGDPEFNPRLFAQSLRMAIKPRVGAARDRRGCCDGGQAMSAVKRRCVTCGKPFQRNLKNRAPSSSNSARCTELRQISAAHTAKPSAVE